MKRILCAAALALMLAPPMDALELTGGVSKAAKKKIVNYGRIGVLISPSGHIGRVSRVSPAYEAGLSRGDVVIEVNGLKKTGSRHVDGEAGESVHLKVKRKDRIFEVDIIRVRPYEIHEFAQPIDTRIMEAQWLDTSKTLL